MKHHFLPCYTILYIISYKWQLALSYYKCLQESGLSGILWHISVISAVKRLKQEDHELKASLSYSVRPQIKTKQRIMTTVYCLVFRHLYTEEEKCHVMSLWHYSNIYHAIIILSYYSEGDINTLQTNMKDPIWKGKTYFLLKNNASFYITKRKKN